MSLPLFPPGPPPPGDGIDAGLREAFRRAHRRRVRTAMTSALPVVAGAVVLSVLPGGGGATSLDDMPPTGRLPVSVSPTAHPMPRADRPGITFGGPGGGAGSDTPAVTLPGRPGPSVPRATARPDDYTPSPRPTATENEPHEPVAGALRFSAGRTGSTRFELAKEVRLDGAQITFSPDVPVAGVYLVSDDGRISGGAFRMRRGYALLQEPPLAWVGSLRVLPAGGYTAYVVADRYVEVSIPLRPQDVGVAARADGPASAWYSGKYQKPTDQHSVKITHRLPIGGGSAQSVGAAGGYYVGAGRQTSTVTTCLTARAAPCADGDPTASEQTDAGIAGADAAIVPIDPGTLARPRDVWVESDAATATSDAELYVWYVVLSL